MFVDVTKMSRGKENINDLVGLLNEINILDNKIMKADLTSPTPSFAQEIIFKFLTEFGMSEVREFQNATKAMKGSFLTLFQNLSWTQTNDF